jgi:hypothetical protein
MWVITDILELDHGVMEISLPMKDIFDVHRFLRQLLSLRSPLYFHRMSKQISGFMGGLVTLIHFGFNPAIKIRSALGFT